MVTLVLALWATPCFADSPSEAAPLQEPECDVEALRSELEEATPTTIGKTYVQLAVCDPETARKVSSKVFDKALPGPESHEALRVAIKRGENDLAREFLLRSPAQERSQAIGFLGHDCDRAEAISQFFTEAHDQLGETFWEDRWHRGLADCHTASVKAMLNEAVENTKKNRDATRFMSVLEVYVRNLGADAIPVLERLATELDDEESLTYVVQAFANAAGVGKVDGTNLSVATSATARILALAPTLPIRAIEQARTTLRALGSEQEADGMARYRWPHALEYGQGTYEYAVVAIEDITCKNGQHRATMSWTTFQEEGTLWPDQLQGLLPERLEFDWSLGADLPCGGQAETSYAMPTTPFASEEEKTSWLEEQKQHFQTLTTDYTKTTERHRASFSW